MEELSKLYQSHEIMTYRHGDLKPREAQLVCELPLSLVLNGQPVVTMACSPQAGTELAVGYLISEGLLKRSTVVRSVQMEGQTIRIQTDGDAEADYHNAMRTVNTCNGRGLTDGDEKKLLPLPLNQKCFRALDLLALSRCLDESSATFKLTGGVHSAAVGYRDRLLCRYEDIGRHNAVDKTLGYAYLRHYAMEDKCLVLSGRIASEILLKAYRHGLPLVLSRSAPTLKAVELAQRLNMTVVGFARGEQFNVYCGRERIDL